LVSEHLARVGVWGAAEVAEILNRHKLTRRSRRNAARLGHCEMQI
jgi:hypothetical protein